MIRPSWRKILSDMTGNPTRTMIVVFSIAIGIFAVGFVASSYILLSRCLTGNWQSINPANVQISCDAFEEDMVETVRKIPGVADAEGRQSTWLRVRQTAATLINHEEPWQRFELIVIPDFNNMRVNKVTFLTDHHQLVPNEETKVETSTSRYERRNKSLPEISSARSNGEVFLERATMRQLKVIAGDKIQVETGNGRVRDLLVTGAVHDGSKVAPFLSNELYGYVTPDTLEELGRDQRMDTFNIIVEGNNPSPEIVRQVAKKVRSKLESSGRTVRYTALHKSDEHPASGPIIAMMSIMSVLGICALFLSAFLLINTISSILVQQVRHIGVMKAIGADAGQILKLYMGLVFGYSVLAMLIAIPLAAILSNVLVHQVSNMFNFDPPDFSIPLQVIAMEVFVGLVIPFLAAIVPVYTGTRITIREAISSYGLGGGEFGKSFIDRTMEKIKGISRPLLLSLRNTFRRKARLALTLATLTIGGAIFIGVFSVYQSLMLTLDDALAYFNYDVVAYFDRPHRVTRIEDVVNDMPEVMAVESWGAGGARLLHDENEEQESDRVIAIAPPAATRMLKPNVVQGRWLVSDDENAIVINAEVKKLIPTVQIGDEILLKIDRDKTRWRVVGVVRSILTGPMVYINYPWYQAVTHKSGTAGSVQISLAQHTPEIQAAMAKKVESRMKEAGMPVSRVQTTAELRQAIVKQFNIIAAFLLFMACLMGVVGGLGLMGTMTMNVLERTREIGVMRATGASTQTLLRIFIIEGIVIGMMSWILGAMLAFPVSLVLSDMLGTLMLKSPLSYTFSFLGVLLWLMVVIILATVASFLPAWNATRISVREAIQYE